MGMNKTQTLKYIKEADILTHDDCYGLGYLYDYEVVLEMVKKCPSGLEYADEEMQDNYAIVLTAVSIDGNAVEYASERLRNDYNIAITALNNIRKGNCILDCLGEDLQDNYVIVLTSVSINGRALQYASQRLQNDYHIVKVAVKNCPLALTFASDDLRNNYEIVKNAVEINGEALQYATKEMQDNNKIVRIAVAENGWALRYASDGIKKYNFNTILIAVKNKVEAIQFIKDKEWFLEQLFKMNLVK